MQIPEITPFFLGLIIILFLKLLNDWLVTSLVIFTKSKEKPHPKVPVSIIICARNESENLIQFIPKIMEQDYPEFEVVVVDDRSIDDTQVLLKAFENKYDNLKITRVQKSELHWAGKKFALTIGLKSATHQHVLLTDADCFPASDQWVKHMTAQFSKTRKIILGYGSYQKLPGVLNKLIRSETILIALQYLGLAKMGIPYMGVGRNLAYDKELFFDNRGFASHQFMPSGDDDLFINEVATPKNTNICFDQESYTLSIPESSFSAWSQQKRRHLTTSNRYSLSSKAALIYITLVRYIFYAGLVTSLFFHAEWLGLAVFGLNLFSLLILHYKPLKMTSSLDLMPWIPISEIFLLLYYPFLFIWNTVVSGNPWKNY
ncbi:MAG: glycosyl transferase family 2 [Crocinitomicaceae bacterium]|nr:glycosyl transferase family 2 [Crocinitomicaceae bacterium]|tara:strand:- start:2736 stop:3854 length:1119 start_codon:yes stop_codon:yes gene_type:complete